MARQEVLEGYVVDLACLRRYPQDELHERASRHTTECALMGHCIESGYGLVDDEGRVRPLDTHATKEVVHALRSCGRAEGVRLRVQRRMEGEAMRTERVEETAGR